MRETEQDNYEEKMSPLPRILVTSPVRITNIVSDLKYNSARKL